MARFDTTIPIARALIQLLKPLAEVVIHDLETQTIAFIEGGLSKRQVGDLSLLEADVDWKNAHFPTPYQKLNWDGRLIKSVSVPLQNPDGLLCLNLDVSHLQKTHEVLAELLLSNLAPQPTALFKDDWQERIHVFIHERLRAQNLSLSALSTRHKKDLVHALFDQGAFEGKRSVDYVANILNMGRTTVFNYLRDWKNDRTPHL